MRRRETRAGAVPTWNHVPRLGPGKHPGHRQQPIQTFHLGPMHGTRSDLHPLDDVDGRHGAEVVKEIPLGVHERLIGFLARDSHDCRALEMSRRIGRERAPVGRRRRQ